MSFEQALEQLLATALPLGQSRATQVVALSDACGRVLAKEVVSRINVPPMDNSSMDGYAINSADALLDLPVSQRIPAGSAAQPLKPRSAARIFTGAPIPAGADAIVMQELVTTSQTASGDTIKISGSVNQGQWIRCKGEDIAQGSVVVAAGVLIDPIVCGLIASVGQADVTVYERFKVACFFTGDELTMPGEALREGAIYNSNRFVLTAALRALGCDVLDLGIVPDTLAATRAALVQAASKCDLILTSGGVSVGEEDHVKPAVQAEGSIDLWQISMKPGKPLAWGRVRKTLATNESGYAQFIGLPGNPVSSFITFLLLGAPFIRAMQGLTYQAPVAVKLQANFDWLAPDKRREFLRASVDSQGQLILYPTQSSGALTSLARSTGLIDNPGANVIKRGDWVSFIAFARAGL